MFATEPKTEQRRRPARMPKVVETPPKPGPQPDPRLAAAMVLLMGFPPEELQALRGVLKQIGVRLTATTRSLDNMVLGSPLSRAFTHVIARLDRAPPDEAALSAVKVLRWRCDQMALLLVVPAALPRSAAKARDLNRLADAVLATPLTAPLLAQGLLLGGANALDRQDMAS